MSLILAYKNNWHKVELCLGGNFAAAFLSDGGRMLANGPLEQMLRQLDHPVKNLGEDRVGLGPDHDEAELYHGGLSFVRGCRNRGKRW